MIKYERPAIRNMKAGVSFMHSSIPLLDGSLDLLVGDSSHDAEF